MEGRGNGAGRLQSGQLFKRGSRLLWAQQGLPLSRMVRLMQKARNARPMSDPLIRACDDYVVLEPGKPEQLLSAADTLTWLAAQLRGMEQLPADLRDQPSVQAAAQRLLDTACDLELSPGLTLQWFAVRLEPPG